MSPQTRDRLGELLAGAALGFVYLLTHSWMYHSVDEMSVVSAAKTVLAGDGWHANQMEWEQSWRKSQTMTGLDGNLLPQQTRAAVATLILPWLAAGSLSQAVGAVQLWPAGWSAGNGAHRGCPLLHGATAGQVRRGRGRSGRIGLGVGTLAWP